ncbi:hypothetical protein [uncultured Desulfobulbus sp.]|uniref:hypothetical protein n=1 Tax=uncultured Desulfobulbus sp. TaxID=239745 RepID=UPI0029C99815|nr:hypothetical protein [uncultured Desulfobulbus sp.]
MPVREIYHVLDAETHKVVTRNGQTTEIHLGRIYRIAPLNKNRKKNVGRRCMILSFSTEFMSCEVRVKYMDNYKEGKADIRELTDDL